MADRRGPPEPSPGGRFLHKMGCYMGCSPEISLLVTALANNIYESFSPTELAVLAAVFTQLGDTLVTLAALDALNPTETAAENT